MEHILTEREVKDLIEACRGALEEFNSVEVSPEQSSGASLTQIWILQHLPF